MKKIAAVAACSALALFACDQGLSSDVRNDAPGVVDRKYKDAENDDGEYTFYFKSGKKAAGDCDGYTTRLNGKTVIYEYFRAGINAWEKRLKDAGVPIEVTKTSNPFRYNSVRFDTALLKGVGLSEFDGMYAKTTIYKNDKNFQFQTGRMYIDSDRNIHIDLNDDLTNPGADVDGTVKMLRSIGAKVLRTHYMMEVDLTKQPSDLQHSFVVIASEDIFFWQSDNSIFWFI